MRILLTGGGTGGHIFPLIAVIRELKKKAPDSTLLFMGPTSFGAKALQDEGVKLYPIVAGKIPRYATPRLFLELVKIPLGIMQAIWKMFFLMPDMVFGKGGFGMVPVAIAARIFRIPVVIHESDAVAGMANRLIARMSAQILTSFPNTKGLPEKQNVRLVGNPVRATVLNGDKVQAQQQFHLSLNKVLLVLGGSQGAQRINELLIGIAHELVSEVEVIHQVGSRNIDGFQKELSIALRPYPGAEKFYHAVPFLDEAAYADACAAADIVVSRAGSGTLFEVALLGLPAILIPLPDAAGNHQYWNARAFSDANAAKLIPAEEAGPQTLLEHIRELLHDDTVRRELSSRVKTLARPEAAADIAEVLVALFESRR